MRIVWKYWIDQELSNGSSPAARPVDFKMQHDVSEASIPAGKTYEPSNLATHTLYHVSAHMRGIVPCVSFRPPVGFEAVKWVNMREKRVRTVCSSHIVAGNRVA